MTTPYNKAYAKQGQYQQNGFAETKYPVLNVNDYPIRKVNDKMQAVLALAVLALACGLAWAVVAFGANLRAIIF